MRTHSPIRRERSHAFTLIELMVTIAIIAFLMGALGMIVAGTSDTAKQADTKAFIAKLAAAVNAFSEDFKGQGVVPDRWPGTTRADDEDDTVEIFELFPSGRVDDPADFAEIDNSSRFLVFWLANRLKLWRRPNPDSNWLQADAYLFGPHLDDLKKANLGLSVQDRKSKQESKEIDDFLELLGNDDVDLTNEAPNPDDPNARVEFPIWELDMNSALDSTKVTEEADSAWRAAQKIVLVDAWGNPIRYLVLSDEHRPHRFFIASAGADRQWNTYDDITNIGKPLAVDTENARYANVDIRESAPKEEPTTD